MQPRIGISLALLSLILLIFNSYADVLPIKNTAVKLKPIAGVEDSDYINANFVFDELEKRQLYISCQAPLVSTFNDFWRMIWEQRME
jgi:protein tyrosine phosphatase